LPNPLLCRFHGAGGPILNARVEIAQETLATKVGISRTWCNILLGRLADAGWIAVHAPKLPDGMNSRSTIVLGPTLKRLVYKLWRAPGKTSTKSAVNPPKHSVPFSERKRLEFIKRKEEEPPPERILNKIPLLRDWLGRG